MTSSFQYAWAEPLVTIDNVSVGYDGVPVLKNLSAGIRNVTRPGMSQGQITALLGPSGCGKTTLFRVLAGILQPDTGIVLIGPQQHPVSAGDVGVVAQNYPLLEHRTVRGNLYFAARQTGYTKNEADGYAIKYLDDFGLTGMGDKYPAQLSGGQRQRLAIAQQLICSKHYLIMDEPFSGLDVVALSKVRSLILEVAARNEENTFIVVTHDVSAAISVADTVWLMGRDRDAKGQIIPGARIIEVIDLIEQDIAWHPDPVNTPNAVALIRDIKKRFLTL